MAEVVQLFPDAVSQLRCIADQMERGDLIKEATVIVGAAVFHCGEHELTDVELATATVWDCNYAIHKLMRRVHGD